MVIGDPDEDPMDDHECEELVTLMDARDRHIWIGELTEPIPGHPEEKFCLHIGTPYKDVVFGCDGDGDAGIFATIAAVLNGNQPVNESWVQHKLALIEADDDKEVFS